MRGAIDVIDPIFAGSSARAALAKPKGANANSDRKERRFNFELYNFDFSQTLLAADSPILVKSALIMAVCPRFHKYLFERRKIRPLKPLLLLYPLPKAAP